MNKTRQDADKRPNVILLMGDDHAWEETGYNGHPYVQTPVLDEMVKNGLRMDRFYAAAPFCSPTRGSVLTGRHPVRYGTFAPNWSIRPQEVTIAHVLREAGYATGHFGKWHVGPVKKTSPTSPGAMGFDEWLSHDNFFEMNPTLSRNGGPPQRFKGEGSALIVDEAIRFIDESARDGKPFLALVWFGSPHEPYSGMEDDLKLYDCLKDKYTDCKVRITSNKTGKPIWREQGKVLRERYAEITAMDRAIGTLRTSLEHAGLRKNTLLWYNSDNGMPGHAVIKEKRRLRKAKGSMYEGGIRVPGIIEWPARIRAARTSQVPALTSDILPTLAKLAGQQIPKDPKDPKYRPLDGIDLTQLIDGPMTARPAPIFFWSFDSLKLMKRKPAPYIAPELQAGTTPLVKYNHAGKLTRDFENRYYQAVESDTPDTFAGPRAVLDNDYKLVFDGSPKSDGKLFNLARDENEGDDLIKNPPSNVDVKKLIAQLSDWQICVLNSLTGADY